MEVSAECEAASKTLKIGFIGAGNMAKAIIEGIIKANLFQSSQIYISHPSAVKAKKYSYLNIENEFESNEQVVQNCDVIILCVKPQILQYVCLSIKNLINPDKHLVLSICAGISLEKLSTFLGQPKSLRLGRWMLNTAALIGSSCSVYSQNGCLTTNDKAFMNNLLSSVGLCVGEVKDSEMDAAMSICGCGIAYMYMMTDALSDGGVKMGLTRDMALKLSMQTMKGASELMLKQFGIKHPMQLKDEVCSPGGTTITGVHELERNGFRNSVICAVEASTNKAKQF